MAKEACCVAASVLLFLPLALWLHSTVRVTPAQRAVVARNFVHPDECHPEPGERLAYLAGIVFLPACLFGLAFVCRRWRRRLPTSAGLAWGVEITLAVALAVFTWLALLADEYLYLRLNLFFVAPLLAVPLLPAALVALRWAPRRPALGPAGVARRRRRSGDPAVPGQPPERPIVLLRYCSFQRRVLPGGRGRPGQGAADRLRESVRTVPPFPSAPVCTHRPVGSELYGRHGSAPRRVVPGAVGLPARDPS